MPSKTLEDKRELILPKITLTVEQPIGGTGMEAKTTVIADDPAHPELSRVHWSSEALMSFDIKPEDEIPTGVMTILVTNPDGKGSTTIEKGLAVLPPPVISEVKPPAICDDQADQQITITGTNFLVFDDKVPSVTVGDPPAQHTYVPTVDAAACTPLQGNFVEKSVALCTSMTITIAKGDFVVDETTKVKVVVTNPAPADCASSESIELTIEPPPKVTSVVPATVCEGGSQLTINGLNFQQGATVTLDCAGTMVAASAANVMDGKTISASFGPGAVPSASCDVIVTNPDGSVGVLAKGYAETANAPPVVTGATPSSISASSGQAVILAGQHFDAAGLIELMCVDALGNSVAAPPVVSVAPVCNGSACTQSITIDGSALAAGDVCLVRVTNPDGTYGDYSAIGVTTPALNLNSPKAGTAMNVGRRALSAASGNATPAARFVYALGGDDGTSAGALDSTEFASVDLFGKMGAWTQQKTPLSSKRTLAGSATVGRYIYLIGGDDGAGPTDTAERALILSPRETPVVQDVDLALGKVGLDAGEWHYRVSAVFSANDTDNPGGESLPSDAFSIKIPTFPGKKIAVTLVWSAPVDSLGAPLLGVAGYNIYRSAKPDAAPGTEVLVHTVKDAATLTFTDDGTAVPGAETPLPTGSTGAWLALPKLGAKRSGLAVAAGDDPVTPGKLYVYALLGKSAAATVNTSYDFLPVTVAPNGRQTAAAAWTTGAQQTATGRWQLGAWTATRAVSNSITAPDTFIFLGAGELANNTTTGKVEAGKIAAGGDLGVLDDTPKDFSSTNAGYGVCAANGQLFVFGGAGGAPSSGAKSAAIVAPAPTLANNSWNSEGSPRSAG